MSPAYPRPETLPPGPAQPAWLQTLRYVIDPLPFLDDCAARYGDLFTVRLLGTGTWVFLAHPELERTFFTGDPKVLHAGEANASVFGGVSRFGTHLFMDEEAHRQRRRILQPAFGNEPVQRYLTDIGAAARQALSEWPMGRPFSMHLAMQRMTLRVILKLVFGLEDAPEHRPLPELLQSYANEVIASPLMLMPYLQRNWGRFSPWGRVVRLADATNQAVEREIARRRRQTEPSSDMLALILAARDEAGRPLSDLEACEESLILLIAGHETTASALAWTFERVLSQPEVLQKLQAELREAGDFGNGAPVLRLPYLDAVIKETHRTRPIMPIAGSRRLTAPFELGGYRLPAGITVSHCVYLLHRRAELFPQPERFLPERFLERRYEPYEFAPFGGGVRHCLGASLAQAEMKMVLATVLSACSLEILRPDAAVARRGFFLVPEGGPKVRLTARRTG